MLPHKMTVKKEFKNKYITLFGEIEMMIRHRNFGIKRNHLLPYREKIRRTYKRC